MPKSSPTASSIQSSHTLKTALARQQAQTQELALLGLMLALTLALSVVDQSLPRIPLPIPYHYGLANIPILFTLYAVPALSFSKSLRRRAIGQALVLTAAKVFFAFATRGPLAGLVSLAGSLGAILTLVLFLLIFGPSRAFAAASVSAALAHNFCQGGIALVVLGVSSLHAFQVYAYLIPIMIVAGFFTGLMSAGLASILIQIGRLTFPIFKKVAIQENALPADDSPADDSPAADSPEETFPAKDFAAEDLSAGNFPTTTFPAKSYRHLIQLLMLVLILLATGLTYLYGRRGQLLASQRPHLTALPLQQSYFDTVTVIMVDPDQLSAKEAILAKANEIFSPIDKEFSPYRALTDQEKAQLQARAREAQSSLRSQEAQSSPSYQEVQSSPQSQEPQGAPIEVDSLAALNYLAENSYTEFILPEEMGKLMTLALDLQKESREYFSPCLGKAIAYWSQAAKEGRVPSQTELKALLPVCDVSQVTLSQLPTGTYRLSSLPGLRWDLGGIAKGWAVERLAEAYRAEQRFGILINAGGNVVAVARANHQPFQVAPFDPRPGARNVDPTLLPPSNKDPIPNIYIEEGAVVTSGAYQRPLKIQDQVFGHILDPHSLWPASEVLQVTVVAKDSALADFWSTTLFAAPVEEARKLIAAHQLATIVVHLDGRVEISPAMAPYLAP